MAAIAWLLFGQEVSLQEPPPGAAVTVPAVVRAPKWDVAALATPRARPTPLAPLTPIETPVLTLRAPIVMLRGLAWRQPQQLELA